MYSPTHYLIVDLEATCSENDSIPLEEREIIEFGSVVVNAKLMTIDSEFNAFVKPISYPELTKFCTELTTIRQCDVDGAGEFVTIMKKFLEWQSAYGAPQFCCWGEFDFVQLRRECQKRSILCPFSDFLNLKQEFSLRNGLSSPCGMRSALRMANLSLLGVQHRGIDDARNLAQLMPFIVGDGQL